MGLKDYEPVPEKVLKRILDNHKRIRNRKGVVEQMKIEMKDAEKAKAENVMVEDRWYLRMAVIERTLKFIAATGTRTDFGWSDIILMMQNDGKVNNDRLTRMWALMYSELRDVKGRVKKDTIHLDNLGNQIEVQAKTITNLQNLHFTQEQELNDLRTRNSLLNEQREVDKEEIAELRQDNEELNLSNVSKKEYMTQLEDGLSNAKAEISDLTDELNFYKRMTTELVMGVK